MVANVMSLGGKGCFGTKPGFSFETQRERDIHPGNYTSKGVDRR